MSWWGGESTHGEDEKKVSKLQTLETKTGKPLRGSPMTNAKKKIGVC